MTLYASLRSATRETQAPPSPPCFGHPRMLLVCINRGTQGVTTMCRLSSSVREIPVRFHLLPFFFFQYIDTLFHAWNMRNGERAVPLPTASHTTTPSPLLETRDGEGRLSTLSLLPCWICKTQKIVLIK